MLKISFIKMHFSFERQTLCLVTENHLTRNSAEFIILEQTVLVTYRDCNIDICCNDIQDISLVLQRVVKQDTVEVRETTDQSNIETKEDENNNEKDFDQEENIDKETPRITF